MELYLKIIIIISVCARLTETVLVFSGAAPNQHPSSRWDSSQYESHLHATEIFLQWGCDNFRPLFLWRCRGFFFCKMNVPQLRSLAAVRGQSLFLFLFFLTSLVAALWRRPGAVSKPCLFSLWLSRKVERKGGNKRRLLSLAATPPLPSLNPSHYMLTHKGTCANTARQSPWDAWWPPCAAFIIFLFIHLVIYLAAHFGFFFERTVRGSGAGNMHAAARCPVRFN